MTKSANGTLKQEMELFPHNKRLIGTIYILLLASHMYTFPGPWVSGSLILVAGATL